MRKNKQLKLISKPSNRGFFILVALLSSYALFSILIIETIHRGSFLEFFTWINESTTSFFITFLFLFSLAGIMVIFPNIIFIILSFVLLLFWFIVALGSHTKYLLRGEYFTPFDLALLDESADISKYIEGIFTNKDMVILVTIIAFMGIFSYILIRSKAFYTFKIKLTLSIISLLCFIGIIFNPNLFTAKSFNTEFEMVDGYKLFGFIGGYFTLIEKAKTDIPNNYNEEKIQRVENYLDEKTSKEKVDQEFKPNIIVVLAESMWDPTILENITFHEDPLPFFHSLTENYSSGSMLSHTYGGGTFNIELEVLTGISTRFVAEEVYYNQITKPIDSIAHVLKNQGYHTTALHNYKHWYYGRSEVYKLLGFEKFVSEEFFDNPDYIGWYINDQLLMEKALQELKESKGPDFLNIVTVASHGPYTHMISEFQDSPDLTSSNMTDESKFIINNYSKVMRELDENIRLLIKGVERLNEPTIVVIYGDHLPFLGENMSLYKETGYIEGEIDTYNEYRKMYETPLLVWNNFEDPLPKENLMMTPNFIGSFILSKAKQDMSPIFQMNRVLYNEGHTIIPKKEYFEEVGINEEDFFEYQLLQYDILKGKQYLYKDKDINPVDDFILGTGKMQINSISVTENNQNEVLLDVKGSNFVSNAKAFLSDQEQQITFKNNKNIKITVSKDVYHKSVKHQLVLKLFDDNEKLIAQSNTKEILIK
ncbi:LTA synthase family protein [Fredinandcohnia onubensis]|uniref:LTA synthase family protein n=1 Tax=Fredinandcohnia onubensis TaxID=1571209 RepID=UPI000C0BC06D|nr:alkaline phosphatase family protein [Fredinandcohnia onubensis]